MAKDQNRRLAPGVLAEDETGFNALQKLDDYVPPNANHSTATLKQAFEMMLALRAAEDQAAAAHATARDAAVNQEWAFHNLILGAKDAVRAQYGKDSAQVQAVGLKRTSEYKRPKSKAKKAP